MIAYAGFERSDPPTPEQMAWLKANSNLSWCGYYLGPTPSHFARTWRGRRAGLVAAGWGLAPIYVGQQVQGPGSEIVTPGQGALDGADTCRLLAAEGFPPGAFVYLDLENGPPFTTPQQQYVAAWIDAVLACGYSPSVYCSFLFAKDVQALRPGVRIWVFHVRTVAPHRVLDDRFPDPDPASSGFTGAAIWQHDDSAVISCAGQRLLVDLDSAASDDPSK